MTQRYFQSDIVASGQIYEYNLPLRQVYALSGLYQTSGTSYTKSESDSRYNSISGNFTELASQNLTGVGSTLSVTDGVVITPFTLTGNIASTAAPFIAAGRNGQFIILRNDDGSDTLTLTDTNLNGSLIRLSSNTVAMAPGSTMGLEYSTTQGAWIELWYLAWVAVTPAIASYTIDGSTTLTHEWGDGSTANDTAPVFAATYTGVPTQASGFFTAGSDASWPFALTTPFLAGTGPQYFRSATRNGTRTLRLTATVNGTVVNRDVVITYRAPNYYGVSTQASNLTSAQVVALTHALDTDPYATYSSIPATGATDRVWFGFVNADATLDTNLFFAIAGERAKFTLRDNPVSVTSSFLKVQNYQTYNSDISQLGTVNVVVQSSRPPTKRYVGVSATTGPLSQATIKALAQSDLTESPNGTWTSLAGLSAGQSIWFCASNANVGSPVHFGLGIGTGSGGYEEASFTAAALVSVTNVYGYAENYVNNYSNVSTLQAININGVTNSVWSLKTQAAAFNRRIFMGPHTDAAITSAHILTLDDSASTGSSVLASTVAGSYAVTITGSNYLWFCHPSTLSDLATIKDHVTGFAVGGSYLTNVSHTTDTGESITMRVWRSTNVGIFPTGGTVDIT